MQPVLTVGRRLLAILFVVPMVSPVLAGPPSDTLLPRSTKGYLSVANPKQFDERWDKTQLGQMWNDDIMQPFVEDFRKQLQDEFGSVERKLGLKWDDLKGVTAGELSGAIIERKGQEAALAITIDVVGHEKQAAGLLAAVEKRFVARGGKKTTSRVGDTTLQVFAVPTETAGKTQQTVYFVKDNLLCGIDDRAEAEAMLKRFAGGASDNLKSIPAYTATMANCKREAGNLEPEARWFVEPFGLLFASRTIRTSRHPNDQDTAKILLDNGFDALQGVGGYINQSVDGHVELLARTSIYAPAVKGKESDPLRWDLSMRMLQMPNGPSVEPPSWAPRMLASYKTVNLKLTDAFDNIGPLFDAMQDHEDAWKNTLEGWTTDPYGPQVDVRKDFIGNMGHRITVLTSYDTPISDNSERSVFAIEVKNEQALAKTLEKWMSNEPDVVRREVDQYIIWERTTKMNDVSEPDVEVPGFTTVGSKNKSKTGANKKERERVLPNSAVTVALGHVMMASDINYLTEVVEGFAQRERLASSTDYQQMQDVMNKLAPGDRCGYAFGRSDEEVRPTFELIRQGRMPESKSMLGKLLNNMLTTEADRKQGTVREQQIDGSSLPEFEAVRRYFGPHARVMRSDKDGWFITGVLLNKEAP